MKENSQKSQSQTQDQIFQIGKLIFKKESIFKRIQQKNNQLKLQLEKVCGRDFIKFQGQKVNGKQKYIVTSSLATFTIWAMKQADYTNFIRLIITQNKKSNHLFKTLKQVKFGFLLHLQISHSNLQSIEILQTFYTPSLFKVLFFKNNITCFKSFRKLNLSLLNELKIDQPYFIDIQTSCFEMINKKLTKNNVQISKFIWDETTQKLLHSNFQKKFYFF